MLISSTRQLMKYVPVSLDLAFESVESAIRNAETRFILPHIGRVFYQEISNKQSSEGLTGIWETLADMINSATGPLAMWEFSKIGGVSVDSSGIYKPKNDGRWNLSDMEQKKLEGSYLNTGLCALDDMINFLKDNVATFTTYAASDEYKKTFNSLVPTAKVVEDVFSMLYPNVTFRAMQESIRYIERRIASNMQGYHAGLLAIPEGSLSVNDKKFREAARSAIIYLATARALLTRTVKLTAQGLEVMMGERTQVSEPENARIESAVRQYEASGEQELQRLLDMMNTNPPTGYTPPVVVTAETSRMKYAEDSKVIFL